MVADIREADLPGDVAALERLWLEYLTWATDEVEARFGFPESAAKVVEHDIATIERFGPPDGRLLLAFVDDAAVGTVCMQRIGPDMAELKRMYVQPAHRHGGLGRALVDQLVSVAGRSGHDRILLDSPNFMTAAHRLYRASGFVEIGPYPGNEIPEDLWPHWLFMERVLTPDAADSPKTRRATRGDQMSTDPERLRRFAEDYTAAWCSMDASRVAAHFAPDGSLAINGGAPSVGRDAIAAIAQGYYTDLPDMQVYLDHLVVEGDRIEYHWTFTGTNTGPGGTGNAVRVPGYEEWTIDDDGLIAASHGHYDRAEYARQLEHGV